MIELEGMPELVDPVMIAAFEGWNDAGDAASGAVEHLDEVWQAEHARRARPRGLLRLPGQPADDRLRDDGAREIEWPTTRVTVARLPLAQRDVVLVARHRAEHALADLLRESCWAVADELGVEMVVTLGALLADTPHTRPVPVTGHRDRARPGRARSASRRRTYEGPTGIVGVLQDACTAGRACRRCRCGRRCRTTSPQPPCPKATLALLRKVEDLLDIQVPLGDLAEEARAWQTRGRRAGRGGRRGRRLRALAGGGPRHRRAARGERRRDRARVRALPAGRLRGPSRGADRSATYSATAQQGGGEVADQAGGGAVVAAAQPGLLGPAVDRREGRRRVEVVGEPLPYPLEHGRLPAVRRRGATAARHRASRCSASSRSSVGPLPVARGSGGPAAPAGSPSGRARRRAGAETKTRLPRDLDIFSPSRPTMPACT